MYLPLVGLVLILTGCTDRVGPLGFVDSWRVSRQGGQQPFDAEAWRRGDPVLRGAMVTSLLQQHLPDPKRNSEVFALLGQSDCYLGYEDEPCYWLELGGKRYQLQFPVNHSSDPGRILAVDVDDSAP